MTDYFTVRAKRANQRQAESEGRVADSLEVRSALLAKMDAGEMTLDQVQAEIKRIKRGAKARGLITRSQAYR